MNVLQLGKFYPVAGGVEKVMFDCMTGLSARGIHCDMLCAALPGEKEYEYPTESGGKVIAVRSLSCVSSTMISPAMVSRLRRICDRYDIIHIHHPDPMASVALFLSGYRGKVVLHWHSDILRQRFLLSYYTPLLRWLLRRSDAVITTSPVYASASPWLGALSARLYTIPIGISPVAFRQEDAVRLRRRFGERKVIFSLGRLVGYKGMEYVAEAGRYLPDDYAIVIGGHGPLENSLRRLTTEKDLQGKVYVEGYIPEVVRGAYFAISEAFCLGSIARTEAFGIVQIESMAAGRPVIATDIPGSGVGWVNCHGISGVNVPPESGRCLAEGILEVCGNPETYRRYCANALVRYKALFSKERMIDSLIGLYSGVLAGSGEVGVMTVCD